MNRLVYSLWCVLLYLFFLTCATSVIPNQEHLRSANPSGIKDKDVDYVSLLRIRSNSFPSLSKPLRPYSLSMNEEDYYYAPKPKHLRPARLLRVLGSSFDPFWMSIERPAEAGVWTSKTGSIHTESSDGPTAPLNLSVSPELTESAARYQRKLQKDAGDLNFNDLPVDVAKTLRDWLVRSATCGLRYQWVHLAPVFWPRWMRHTDCEQSGGSRSCSFPSGMTCSRAQSTQIKILAWHCWGSEEVGGDGLRSRSDKGTEMGGTGETGKSCVWRQVPYPVVTACKCAC